MENNKKLLVTLADQNFVEQAKQLFSSVYWNAGWQGDYMLLSHQIEEANLLWFRRKGIIVKECQPLYDGRFLKNIHTPTVLSKFYLFTKAFKKWDNIIYLDADIIVRSSLDFLTQPPKEKLLCVKSTTFLKRYFLPFKKWEEFELLKKNYNLRCPAFNSGVMSFNSHIIKENTFDDLVSIFYKYKNICTGDEPVLNLYFHKQWLKLPIIYNVRSNYLSVCKNFNGIILHFATPFTTRKNNLKPWQKENPYHKEWLLNLKRVERIDLKNTPPPVYWNPLKKALNMVIVKSCLEVSYIKQQLENMALYLTELHLKDKIIQQIGLIIKKINNNWYVSLRKILKLDSQFDIGQKPIGLKNLMTDVNISNSLTKHTATKPLKNPFKIIQSFSQFDTGVMYAEGHLFNKEVYLNFYSFLLSYLTLKKYYGAVAMYCNQKAYDTFIKFIPYDEIVIKENRFLTHKYWSAYKLDVIADVKTPFIHVDSDVFVFDDLFRPFIENHDKYDVIVQNILPKEKNLALDFVKNNATYLKDNNFMDDNYDGKCLSCGVLGMGLEVKKKYLSNTEKMLSAMENEEVNINLFRGMVLEELAFYFTVLNYNLKVYDVLPYNDVSIYKESIAGENFHYTHLWFYTKFQKQYIDLVKNKIKTAFSDMYYLVENYEAMLNNENIKLHYI